jgi:hypothetical protein
MVNSGSTSTAGRWRMQLTQTDPDRSSRLDPRMEPSRPKKESLDHRSRSLEVAVRRPHCYTQRPGSCGACGARLGMHSYVPRILTGKSQQHIEFIGCGGVCMLMLHFVTRLADLGDMSAQLQDDLSDPSSRFSLHRGELKTQDFPSTTESLRQTQFGITGLHAYNTPGWLTFATCKLGSAPKQPPQPRLIILPLDNLHGPSARPPPYQKLLKASNLFINDRSSLLRLRPASL